MYVPLFTRSALGLACCLAFTSAALGDNPGDIVKVEEDWRLVVGQANAESAAPQVATAMFVAGESPNSCAMFLLNYRNSHSFTAGGMEVQMLAGDAIVESDSAHDHEQMENANEVVTWTQRLSVEGCQLKFEVLDGHSQTWGEFGDSSHLRLQRNSQCSNLNYYSAAYSWENSGVQFGANRVQSLRLVGGRRYTRDGRVYSWSVAE